MMKVSATVDPNIAFDIVLLCVKNGYHFTLCYADDDEEE